jgi:hypothetical protein
VTCRIVRTSPAVTAVIVTSGIIRSSSGSDAPIVVAGRIIGALTTSYAAVIVTGRIISSLSTIDATIVVTGGIIRARSAQSRGIRARGIVESVLGYARGRRLEGGVAGAGAQHQRGNHSKSKGTTAHDITPES